MGIDLGDFNGSVRMMDVDEVDDISNPEPTDQPEPEEQTWREYVDDRVVDLS